MILVDTSVWISFLRKDDPDLAKVFKSYLKRNEVFTVSAVFGELCQGAKSNRERAVIETIYESLPKIEEYNLFLEAGELSNHYNLYSKGVGLIDCYILAACLRAKLSIWTLDKKLKEAYKLIIV